MARNEPQFNIRYSQELKDKIADAAKKSGRSLNAEINFRLEESFAKELPPWEKESSIKKGVEDMEIRELKELLTEAIKAIKNL